MFCFNESVLPHPESVLRKVKVFCFNESVCHTLSPKESKVQDLDAQHEFQRYIFMFRSTMILVQVFSKKAAGMEEMKRISDFNLG